jgi:hypothetical protein
VRLQAGRGNNPRRHFAKQQRQNFQIRSDVSQRFRGAAVAAFCAGSCSLK